MYNSTYIHHSLNEDKTEPEEAGHEWLDSL